MKHGTVITFFWCWQAKAAVAQEIWAQVPRVGDEVLLCVPEEVGGLHVGTVRKVRWAAKGAPPTADPSEKYAEPSVEIWID